jgi:hypothetical protein
MRTRSSSALAPQFERSHFPPLPLTPALGPSQWDSLPGLTLAGGGVSRAGKGGATVERDCHLARYRAEILPLPSRERAGVRVLDRRGSGQEPMPSIGPAPSRAAAPDQKRSQSAGPHERADDVRRLALAGDEEAANGRILAQDRMVSEGVQRGTRYVSMTESIETSLAPPRPPTRRRPEREGAEVPTQSFAHAQSLAVVRQGAHRRSRPAMRKRLRRRTLLSTDLVSISVAQPRGRAAGDRRARRRGSRTTAARSARMLHRRRGPRLRPAGRRHRPLRPVASPAAS